MKYAWIENGAVRDTCSGDPKELFYIDVAVLYSVEVPDHITSGATLVDGEWTNYVPPPPPQEIPQEDNTPQNGQI